MISPRVTEHGREKISQLFSGACAIAILTSEGGRNPYVARDGREWVQLCHDFKLSDPSG